jgi:2-polyprenyl-3-methyl-5-hydroxy-6-metoxy-1,4-benzoquinol methylase
MSSSTTSSISASLGTVSTVQGRYLDLDPVDSVREVSAPKETVVAPYAHQSLLSEIARTYDSPIVRSYCKARFLIINLNILHILALCLRGKKRVLDIGCGFGLFGCYFAKLHPDVTYCGYDQNAERIAMARKAAERLGLKNAVFNYGDARELSIEDQFDAIMMVDLMHHINDETKKRLVDFCSQHLSPTGSLLVKDISTHSRFKTFFTWALDVVMTRGFDMSYWSESQFHNLLGEHFARIETFPLSDWLPYPHIVYLCEQKRLTN